MGEVTANNDRVEQFAELFQNILENVMEMGALYVRAITDEPEMQQRFFDRLPHLSRGIWHDFEMIGRRYLHASLLLNTTPGALRLKRLPYALQERHLQEPVELLTETGALLVKVDNLSPSQAAQIFDRYGIRDLPAQKAWLVEQAAKKARKEMKIPIGPSYTVHRRKGIVTFKECELTRAQILAIIQEL